MENVQTEPGCLDIISHIGTYTVNDTIHDIIEIILQHNIMDIVIDIKV